MEKEFVSYEIALALKELGFDEKCFLYYGENNILRVFTIDIKDFITNSELPPQYNTCPTFSQAFRWFREKYKMQAEILWRGDVGCFCYKTGKFKYGEHTFSEKDYKTYEEAELECLKKLIEIVKNDRK